MISLMFNAYQHFQRRSQFNSVPRCGRLFQQYSVDQLREVDSERLQYLRYNQVSLRAADYTSLHERLGEAGSTENKKDADRSDR